MKKTVAERKTERPARRAAAAVIDDEPTTRTENDAETRRVGFSVDAAGKPTNIDSMRANTREALRIAFQDEEFLKAIGVAAIDDEETAFLLTVISDGIYDVFTIVMILAARRAGYAPEQCRVLAFTEVEKAKLAKPTAKIINKWLPDLGGKYRDEILLCVTIMQIVATKIMTLRASAQAGSTVAPESVKPATEVAM